MKSLLIKDIKLFASPLTFFFLAFSLMTMIPGYPILVGAFFVCFGIFQSFQTSHETNDMLYTILLPVKKSDCVKSKFCFACLFQLVAFAVMAALTTLRMTVLSGAPVYMDNALMNATPLFLGFVLLIYSAFNLFFLRGFFKTAYKIGRPFILFIVVAFLLIGVAETLHHLPGLSFFNTPSGERMGLQMLIAGVCAVIYAAVTLLSCKSSVKLFDRVDF